MDIRKWLELALKIVDERRSRGFTLEVQLYAFKNLLYLRQFFTYLIFRFRPNKRKEYEIEFIKGFEIFL